jgi:23S rRNA (guanosine2251-2'-O)-methyltransferase
MENSTSIFGIHPVMEAINGNITIEKIWLLKEGKHHRDILPLAKQKNINVSFVPHQKFRKYQSKNHQGVVAFLSPIEFADFEHTVTEALSQDKDSIFLLLDGITDVRNVGSILRTAECVGVSAVIIPQQGSARINSDMVKTSAGAIFNIPICKVNHLKDAIYFLKASGVQTIGATEKAEHNLFNTKISKPVALVMGSEGEGIHKGILKLLDQTYRIPISGQTQSLNVSVAAALFMYELFR